MEATVFRRALDVQNLGVNAAILHLIDREPREESGGYVGGGRVATVETVR
jgi:hypothetical protein